MDRYLMISSDGHAGPPAELYRDYLDPSYHAQFDAHHEQMSALRAASQNAEFRKEWEAQTGGDGGLTAAYDSETRNEMLDREGVAAEVLFPDADVLGTGRLASSPFGSGLGSSGDSDPELVMAGARAHNRWLADFCKAEPVRRMGVAVVPILHDIDAALEEIREVHGLGLRGVMMPTRWMSEPAYHDPRYEPVWSTLEELGMVLH
ncbi:MAG: amidohydrolase family protein, partial [Actinomycetota bacterium]